MMCLCHSSGVRTKVFRVQVVPLLIAAVSPDCHRSAPGDTRGKWQSTKSKNMQPPESSACTQGKFSCWINDSSFVKNLWLSEEDGKLCLQGLSACAQQEDMIIEWLHHTFLNIQCETGRYGAREGKRWSRTGKMWQNQGMCKKGGNQAVGRYLGHTGVFFFNRLHNMQLVCYLGCPAAAALLGNATTMKLCCDSLCRTCYYSPKATIWSFSVPNEQTHKSLWVFVVFSWI